MNADKYSLKNPDDVQLVIEAMDRLGKAFQIKYRVQQPYQAVYTMLGRLLVRRLEEELPRKARFLAIVIESLATLVKFMEGAECRRLLEDDSYSSVAVTLQDVIACVDASMMTDPDVSGRVFAVGLDGTRFWVRPEVELHWRYFSAV